MFVRSREAKGLVFFAMPDQNMVGLRRTSGKLGFTYRNQVVLPHFLRDRILTEAEQYWFPAPTKGKRRVSWVINTCADADEYQRGLICLDKESGPNCPIFNHPRAVAMTRRDLSARALAGVPNLIVPKCIRIKPEDPRDFERAFKANGFTYPVLVRPVASQTASGLVRVNSIFEWQNISNVGLGTRHYFMTQFHDASCAEGYLKMRAAIIGDAVRIHSVTHSDKWRINHNSGETPPDLFAVREREIVEAKLSDAAFEEMMQEIRRRTAMDLIGLDLGILDDGRFVLFEANAAMTMVHDPAYYKSPTAQERLAFLHKPIADAMAVTVQKFIQDARLGGTRDGPDPKRLPSVELSLADG
jgi:glutathione synthase/RimK-type ligase-like ATP-grasp enzyme